MAAAMTLSMAACGGGNSNAPANSTPPASSNPPAASRNQRGPSAGTSTPASDGYGEFTTVEPGKLIMSTEATFPPYEMIADDGSFIGIDVEVAQAIADKLGLELQVDNMGFDAALTAAQAALEDGYRLKIYEAFRPNEATRYLYDTAAAKLADPALVLDEEENAVDPVTGWRVDLTSGFLIDPETEELIDPASLLEPEEEEALPEDGAEEELPQKPEDGTEEGAPQMPEDESGLLETGGETPEEVELTEGETMQLTAAVTPDNATDSRVSWAVSDAHVATVSESGLIEALAEGSAVVTASAIDGSGVVAECRVKVVAAPVVSGIRSPWDGMTDGAETVTVSDLAGRIVYSGRADGLKGASLPHGYYIVATPRRVVKVLIR